MIREIKVSLEIPSKPFKPHLSVCEHGDFWKGPKDGGLGASGANHVIRASELPAPALTPGRGEGLEVELTANGQ